MLFDIVSIENNINKLWNDDNIFEESLKQNQDKPAFIFYDGPPFATGNPHYGHILAGSIKDIICRHAQFKEFNVDRRAGWDCHGLPIEYEIEKKLGLKNYQQILDFGIDNYNYECRQIVLRCSDYWKQFMNRFGRWLDYKNDYKTMDLDYMESVWTVFKLLWEKNLIYQGYKVMPYSTACGTPLSNFEANSNYKLVNEESVIVKFKSKNHDFFYLVWTTTPWTLPSNMMLCLNPELIYTVYKYEQEKYLICETLVNDIFGQGKKKTLPKQLTKFESFKGTDLINDKYDPIFNFYPNIDYTVTGDSFVLDSSGTGIVHMAPAFGEDDFRVCQNNNIIGEYGQGLRCPVDRNGCFTDPLPKQFLNRNVKDCDKDLIDLLKNQDKLFKRVNTSHQYPYCWRSDTPLIYKAVPSIFVAVTQIKELMIQNTSNSNWIPDYVNSKRFKNWLENAQDWGISRNRFWGTPIPLWTDGKEFIAIGDKQELQKMANFSEENLTDIHREFIDQIEIVSPKTGNTLKRVEYVFDCWFESGSMPFASQNYYLDQKINYPANFIAEGLDQTRGWFYTLLVIGTALKGECPFKNVIVNGLVLAEDGKKMSKRLKNYPDPMDVINKYGADCLRLYLISSPAVKSESLKFKQEHVSEVLKNITIPIYNSYKFLSEQIIKNGLDKCQNLKLNHINSENIFDLWIMYKCNQFTNSILTDLDNYILNHLYIKTQQFIDLLNNTYIKLNRDRLKGKINQTETLNSLSTLLKIILNFSIIISSFMPYLSDYLFQSIKSNLDISASSVHLLSYQHLKFSEVTDNEQFDKIDLMNQILESIRIIRNEHNLSNKKAISSIKICSDMEYLESYLNDFIGYIKKEGNLIDIDYGHIDNYSQISYSPNYSAIGIKYKQLSKQVISYLNNKLKYNCLIDSDFIANLDYDLTFDELNKTRTVNQIKDNVHYLSENGKFLIYVNTQENQEIIDEYVIKQIGSYIQKYRKDLQLKAWEKIKIKLITDNLNLIEIINNHQKILEEKIQYSFEVSELNKNNLSQGNYREVEISEYKLIVNILNE